MRKICGPYLVEVSVNGCAHCGVGRMWDIVGPDDTALSQSFGDQEHAEWIAEQMNAAFRAGMRTLERSGNPCLTGVASGEPCKPDAENLRRCTLCGFVVDLTYLAEKPT